MQKSFRGHATVKSATEGIAEVVVSAYGNIDNEGDIVVKGASAKQIAGDYGPNPKGLLDHDHSMKSAVAKTLKWWEEDDGLHIEAQYNLEKQAGQEAFSDLQFYGDDMQFSVTYGLKDVAQPTKDQREAGARRVIKEWLIKEWSAVWLGMNSDTHLVSAKSERTRDAKALIGSYEHLTERLRNALTEAFPSDWLWVRGTMADKVVFEREVETLTGYSCATYEVEYTDSETGITFGEPVEVNVGEVIEPKALSAGGSVERESTDDTRVELDPARVNEFRHLVASTRT